MNLVGRRMALIVIAVVVIIVAWPTAAFAEAAWHSVGRMPGGVALESISCPTAQVCTAAGFTGGINRPRGAVVTMVNGGRTWRTVHIGRRPIRFMGVACPTTTTCDAVGAYPSRTPGTGPARIATTTDGGSLWRITASIPRAFVTGISCPSASVCEVVGYGHTSNAGVSSAVWGTTSGGRAWFPQHLPTLTGALGSIACPTTTTCHAVGTTGGAFTTDGGQSWQNQPLPNEFSAISLACPSTTSCLAVGAAQSRSTIMTTSDGGTTWAPGSLPKGLGRIILDSVSCSQGEVCEAVGNHLTSSYKAAGPPVLLGSSDGGSAWTSQLAPSGTKFMGDAIACSSGPVCHTYGVPELTSGDLTFRRYGGFVR